MKEIEILITGKMGIEINGEDVTELFEPVKIPANTKVDGPVRMRIRFLENEQLKIFKHEIIP